MQPGPAEESQRKTIRSGEILGATVVLVPDQGRKFRIDTFKTAVTDADGKFQMQGIPPGSYRLFAWDDVSPNA